jgi:hypothetical protein
MPGAVVMQFLARNMDYHMGQIVLIQLLYGDTAFRINDEFSPLRGSRLRRKGLVFELQKPC